MKKTFSRLMILCFTVFPVMLFTACGVLQGMDNLPEGERIGSYDSPESTYTLNIYLCNGGATTDFSIRGELVENETDNTKNIYWSYHEQEAEVKWIDKETVVINGRTLNVTKDSYDFRK